jgi:hypothetical protein
MEITNEFIEKSIWDKSFWEFFTSTDYEVNIEVDLPEFLKFTLEQAGAIIQIIRALQQNRFQDAIEGLKYKSTWCIYQLEVSSLRRTIKFFLSGLRKTLSTTNYAEFLEYRSKRDFSDKVTKSPWYNPQIVNEFNNVSSFEEIERFNGLLHQYVSDLAFNLFETYIRRAAYTLEFFQNEKNCEEICKTELSRLKKFKEEVETLKTNAPR